jgi:hypothetical protein
MIVDEQVDRFASNFGVQPTSIALQADWSNPFDAVNVEQVGKSFDEEKDFGYGLQGGRGMGFVETFQDAAEASTVGSGDGGIMSTLHSVFDASSLIVWPLALFTVWQFFGKVKTGTKKRRAAIGKAKAQLAKAKQTSWIG